MKKKLKRPILRVLLRVVQPLVYGVIGVIGTLLVVGIFALNNKPDLELWHTADLDEEFTAASRIESFAEYLALEERLFAQLNREVYDRIEPDETQMISRYHRGSLSDPERWSPNWNRSYELVPPPANGGTKAGVLLLHGLTDSPYSLRNLGRSLHEQGAHVVGLRVPGHGTVPSALTRTTWQDMAGAVTLAVRHLRKETGDRPLYVIGYSNGGALAVHYALSTMENSELPSVEGIVLISPEIGVSRMAGLAIWQERIGRLLGLKKLAWESVRSEYDPFKYVSFPVNAGNLAHQLTHVNREKITGLAAATELGSFPPVLAFQSALDSTVLAPALVRALFAYLPDNGHELVAFDVNRTNGITPLLNHDPKSDVGLVLDEPDRAFVFSLLTNASSGEERMVERRWGIRQTVPVDAETPFTWPKNVYSLSHVSLPIPPDDPLYGGANAGESPGVQIGNAALRGEKGAITIPAQDMLRLRWNPFYPYLEERIMEALGLDQDPE